MISHLIEIGEKLHVKFFGENAIINTVDQTNFSLANMTMDSLTKIFDKVCEFLPYIGG